MSIQFPSEDDLLLIDKYLDQMLDEDGVELLEHRLEQDAELLRFFVDYSNLETRLSFQVHANQSLRNSIEKAFDSEPASIQYFGQWQKRDIQLAGWAGWFAACIACIALFVSWAFSRSESGTAAWIVDTQNCRWVIRDATPGKIELGNPLAIESGLLELGFDCGATVIVQGPARFAVLGKDKLQMFAGRVAVKMSPGESGFQVVSPSGEILDLGTEFGVVVSENGDTEVVVFEGEVVAHSRHKEQRVKLVENESANLTSDGVVIGGRKDRLDIVRKIELPPVWLPQSYSTEFLRPDKAMDNSQHGIIDKNGIPIGFADRLPGTGKKLNPRDSNLLIDHESGKLKVLTTRNDINQQRNLDNGEYFGIELKDLGFTGEQDFLVKARFSKTPLLIGGFGQFGIYIGEKSDRCIRGGLIKWGNEAENNSLFLVNNSDGADRDSNKVGYFYPGSDIEILFSRREGRYSLRVVNHSDGNSNTLEIRHPDFLDGLANLHAGIFVANPFSDKHSTVEVDNFSATVWVKKTFSE